MSERTTSRTGAGAQLGRILLHLAVSVGAVVMITPFVWIALTSLKTKLEVATFTWLPQEFRWQNFIEAMQTAPCLRYFVNSLIIAVGETAVTLVICTMAGYPLANMPIRGSKGLLTYFIVLLMVPFQIILVPLLLITKSSRWPAATTSSGRTGSAGSTRTGG
jgi:multiple sugar transport system permease protein